MIQTESDIINAVRAFRAKRGYTVAPLRACLFDMDGVLIDSMPAHARSWVEASAAYGITAEPLDFYRCEGQKGSDTIEHLFLQVHRRRATAQETDDYYQLKTELFSRYNTGNAITDAPALVADVRANGLHIVLVTGSSQNDILDRLQVHYGDAFGSANVITGTDVMRGKPHPEPYLKALERANVAPWEAIVIENAPMGVRAAVAAGIFTIAVNTGCLPDADLWAAGASVIFPSMANLRSALPALLAESASR